MRVGQVEIRTLLLLPELNLYQTFPPSTVVTQVVPASFLESILVAMIIFPEINCVAAVQSSLGGAQKVNEINKKK